MALRCKLGFVANETLREKMRKFSFVFCQLFRKISHFFAKLNEAKNAITKRNFEEKNHFQHLGVEAGFCLFWWIYANILHFLNSEIFHAFFDIFSRNFRIFISRNRLQNRSFAFFAIELNVAYTRFFWGFFTPPPP